MLQHPILAYAVERWFRFGLLTGLLSLPPTLPSPRYATYTEAEQTCRSVHTGMRPHLGPFSYGISMPGLADFVSHGTIPPRQRLHAPPCSAIICTTT